MVASLPILTDSSRSSVYVQVLPRHAPWRVTAAPRSVARQTLPRHRSAFSVVTMLSTCHATMHGAAQAFRRALAIGAAKSVSFEEKNNVRFKISLQKVLKKLPPEGVLKLNCDASLYIDSLIGGWAFLIRDHDGDVMMTGRGRLNHVLSAFQAGLVACLQGIQVAANFGH